MSRGSFIITQKENKGEYNGIECWADNCVTKPEWIWNETNIYAHVVDQNGPDGGNGAPYRYISATNFGNNVCNDDYDDSSTLLGRAKGLYGNNNQKISNQLSCKANTLNAGNYYNFPAATAGSDNHSVTANTEVFNSICPKGWQLPAAQSDKSYDRLIRTVYNLSATDSDTALLDNPAMSFSHLGTYRSIYGSLGARGTSSSYWLAVARNSMDSSLLYFNSTIVSPIAGASGAHGMSVRCVSR